MFFIHLVGVALLLFAALPVLEFCTFLCLVPILAYFYPEKHDENMKIVKNATENIFPMLVVGVIGWFLIITSALFSGIDNK
jgi:hypothetical protein